MWLVCPLAFNFRVVFFRCLWISGLRVCRIFQGPPPSSQWAQLLSRCRLTSSSWPLLAALSLYGSSHKRGLFSLEAGIPHIPVAASEPFFLHKALCALVPPAVRPQAALFLSRSVISAFLPSVAITTIKAANDSKDLLYVEYFLCIT